MGRDCEAQERAAKESGYVVLFACDAKVCLHPDNKGTRIVVVTERCIQFYEPKSTDPMKSLSYFAITDMSLSQNKLVLTCQTKTHWIQSPKAQEILAHVRDAFGQIFTEQGLAKFNIQKPVVQSNYMVYMRMLEEIRIKNIVLKPSVFKDLKHTILYQRQDACLPFGNKDAVTVMLRILPMCQFISGLSLGVPLEDADVKWLEQSPHLRFLGIVGGIGEVLGSYLKQSQLFNFSVANAQLSSEELCVLENSPCLGFEFHNAIAAHAYPYFFETFISNKAPVLLNMDYTKLLNFKALMAHGGCLKMLSMAFCGLEIQEVLEALESAHMNQLQFLNLSGNKCSARTKMTMKLPDSLFSVMVNDVVWSSGCLVSFFAMVMNSFVNGVRLSISRIQASDTEFNQLFALFGSIPYTPLNSLSWNENPVHENLIKLLEKSPYLVYLSLNRCLSSEDSDIIGKFADYIQATENLKYLRMRGGKGKFLEQHTGRILAAVQKSKIEILDLSKSHCGDKGIADFRNCISNNSSLRIIDLDGIDPSSLEEYQKLLELNQPKTNTRISYPRKDINMLSETENVDPLKAALVIHDESEMGKPFRVFKYEKDLDFPHQISHELQDRLTNETVPPNRVGPLPREISVTDLKALNLMPTSVPKHPGGPILDSLDAFTNDDNQDDGGDLPVKQAESEYLSETVNGQGNLSGDDWEKTGDGQKVEDSDEFITLKSPRSRAVSNTMDEDAVDDRKKKSRSNSVSTAEHEEEEENGLLTDGGEEEDGAFHSDSSEEEDAVCRIVTSESSDHTEVLPPKPPSRMQTSRSRTSSASSSHGSMKKLKQSPSQLPALDIQPSKPKTPNPSSRKSQTLRSPRSVRDVCERQTLTLPYYYPTMHQNMSDNFYSMRDDPKAPKWDMPQLVDISFHSNIWTQKAMQFKMSRLVSALKDDEDTM